MNMALIYFYDATELDKKQLSKGLSDTDHHWEFIDDRIALDNINPDTEVISVFVSSEVNKEIIDNLPKLRLIACRSTGFNNIDLVACKDKGITVVNVPTYGEVTVAEYAFALILSLTRKIPEVLRSKNEEIEDVALNGHDLATKTLGVLGTGHIGQKVIKIANGFDMRVIAYDKYPQDKLTDPLNFEYVALDDLLSSSDIVTLHIPYSTDSRHLINKEKLQQFKKGAILINTARGELVDNRCLIEYLENDHLSGAALDVIEGEILLDQDEEVALLRGDKLPLNLAEHSIEISVLKKIPNVIISPHNAYNTVEAIKRINDTTSKNIIDFWYGEVPNVIKPQPTKTGKLLVIRHAESEWNATGQWTGKTDVHLSEKGFKEAEMLGEALQKLDIKIDEAYYSEQIRSKETLELMLSTSGQSSVQTIKSAAIDERDYGEYTGKNKWQMRDLLGEEQFNRLRRGWNEPVPGGETLKMVYERVLPFYKNEILPKLLAGKNILIVAHGNSIRALVKYIEKISDEEVANLEMIFGQIEVYDVDNEGHGQKTKVINIDTTPPTA